jgi:hypothetical protein
MDIQLLAKQKDNMDPYLNSYYKDYFHQRRAIEGIFGYIKTRFSLLFPFSRSVEGFLVHVNVVLLVYMLRGL